VSHPISYHGDCVTDKEATKIISLKTNSKTVSVESTISENTE
jgi:hypothetical protein